ncbi:MAG: alpha/beta fold hydrolase [Phycisphaerales bacterium JB043]
MREMLIGYVALLSTSAMGASKVMSQDGTPIVYDIHGRGDVAIVFIHGFSCNRYQWREQIDDFTDDHAVVTIDLGGHGESGDDRDEWEFSRFAHDVKSVADELELERMVLVGHSMGGPVVASAAALMEDRVVGIVPVDSFQNVEFEWPEGTVEAIAGQIREDIETFMSGFVGGMLDEGISDELRARLIYDSQNNDADVMANVFLGFGDVSQAQILAECPVPVHAINAALFETNVEGNRKHNESFEVTIVENSGHWVMIEQPEAFNSALHEILDDWLE